MSEEIVSDVPLFDVNVRLATGVRVEDVERLAREAAGMPANQVASLVKALREAPRVKAGSKVPRERADKAAEMFKKAGLAVDITPVLSLSALQAVEDDGKTECPACTVRMVLTETRQCTNCGVYVDKITDELLLRKKLMAQERRKLEFMASKEAKEQERLAREKFEAELRERIRKELEKEYGVGPEHGLFKGKAGRIRAAAFSGVVLVAFSGGYVMNSVLGKPEAKQLASHELAAKVPAIDAEGSTGDADIDDPLIQAARGKRQPDGKGMSIEQAVAASQALAKSSTDPSAPGDKPSAGPAVAAAPKSAAAQAGGGDSAALPAGTASASPAVATGGAVDTPVPLLSKLLLKTDFSKALAEIGQLARAREVLADLKKSPGVAAEKIAAASLQIANMEVEA